MAKSRDIHVLQGAAFKFYPANSAILNLLFDMFIHNYFFIAQSMYFTLNQMFSPSKETAVFYLFLSMMQRNSSRRARKGLYFHPYTTVLPAP